MKKKIATSIITTMMLSSVLLPYSTYASSVDNNSNRVLESATQMLEQKLHSEISLKLDLVETALQSGKTQGIDIEGLLNEVDSKIELALTYRTNLIFPMGDPDLQNPQEITNLFMEQMRANGLRMAYMFGGSSIDYIQAVDYFIDKVKSKGDWDYKRKYGATVRYNFKGRTITGEDLGNIHYGYVGSFLFKPHVLMSAAGFYQFVSNTYKLEWISSYFDDPRDQEMIIWGIDLYNSDFK